MKPINLKKTISGPLDQVIPLVTEALRPARIENKIHSDLIKFDTISLMTWNNCPLVNEFSKK